MNEEPKVLVTTQIPATVRDVLRQSAEKQKRSLTKHHAWILERYAASQEDDAA